MPGVTYKKEVRWVYGGPLVTHVITAPRPLGLYDMKPVLSGGTVLGRQTVTSMQRRASRRATVAGVNGDFFNLRSGVPSGMFMRDGVLATRPERSRSSLGVAFDGTLMVERIGFAGSWSATGFPTRRLHQLNRPLQRAGVSLFTPAWGGRTPRSRRVLDVVLAGLPLTVANGYHTARVVDVRLGGRTIIPLGGAVLQARGAWRSTLLGEARPGQDVTVRLGLKPWPVDVADAIGGGPALVKRGRAILNAHEGFSATNLAYPHPRTAVGQLANGRTILVTVDGRSRASAGVRMWELALEMFRLGAVTAMAFDGGGSSTLAFNGRVLNDPSDGSERPVAEGLMVYYYGVYAPRPRVPAVSPNGDGVADVQVVRAKIARRSTVDLRLLRPNGTVAWRFQGPVRRKTISRRLESRRMVEGKWQWIVHARDERRGHESRMRRGFMVNKTLGFLRLSSSRMRVGKRRGGRLGASVVLTRRASVRITVRDSAGREIRVLASGAQSPGRLVWGWDGRRRGGKVVRPGWYAIRVQARNELGPISLARAVRVVRR
jgi:Phosphodiester glycosidase/FlgD Ig-like domain